MSRTRYELTITDAPSAIRAAENILTQKGFEKKVINSEPVYIKGDGVIAPMQCVGICLGNNVLVLEGWIKDAILGESKLEGFVGMVPKKRLKSTLETIMTAIRCAGNGQV